MKKIWKYFPEVVRDVKKTHLENNIVGHHDWIHALRVGEMAKTIAFNEWGNTELALYSGLAGICHNADRIVQSWTPGLRLDEEYIKHNVKILFDEWTKSVNLEGFHNQKHSRDVDVLFSILRHDQVNSPDDSNIQIALQDADRIINLSLDMFIRSGQFYHDLPAVDFVNFLDDPYATYQKPKSVLRDIAYSLDWVNPESRVCIRTIYGRAIGTLYATQYRQVIDEYKKQIEIEGIYPLPKIPD